MAKLNYQKMSINDIIDWCQENNQTEWLKRVALKEDRNGKKPSYFVIKKAFCEKFMPEIIPVAKAKAKTMYDIIANL